MDRNQANIIISNIEFIKAFAEGKEIQVNGLEAGWEDAHSPTFTLRNAYRIKPEQRWYRVYEYTSGTATLNNNSTCTEQWLEGRSSFIKWLTPRTYYEV